MPIKRSQISEFQPLIIHFGFELGLRHGELIFIRH